MKSGSSCARIAKRANCRSMRSMLARTDGKLGPGSQCVDHRLRSHRPRGRRGTAAAEYGSGRAAAMRNENGAWELIGRWNAPLSAHAPLSQFAQRMVVDRTGLSGNFDFDLKWTLMACRRGRLRLARHCRISIPTVHRCSRPCRSSLALSLSLSAAPVEVLVIDHVERPTPD